MIAALREAVQFPFPDDFGVVIYHDDAGCNDGPLHGSVHQRASSRAFGVTSALGDDMIPSAHHGDSTPANCKTSLRT